MFFTVKFAKCGQVCIYTRFLLHVTNEERKCFPYRYDCNFYFHVLYTPETFAKRGRVFYRCIFCYTFIYRNLVLKPGERSGSNRAMTPFMNRTSFCWEYTNAV